LIAALVSGLVGMAYAEFSSAMPVAGSPFHAHLDALDLHCLIKRGSEVIFLVLIFLS